MAKKIKKKRIKKEYNKELIGMASVGIGGVIFLSLLNLQMGLVGKLFRTLSFNLNGFAAYIIPIIFIAIGAIMLMEKYNNKEAKYITYIILLLLCFTVLLDARNVDIIKFKDRMKVSLALASDKSGGGLIGSFIGFYFYKLFGAVGGRLILIGAIIFLLLNLTNANISKITMYIKKGMKELTKTKKNKSTKSIKKIKTPIFKKEKVKPIINDFNSNSFVSSDTEKKELPVSETKEEDIDNIEETIKETKDKNKNEDYIYPPLDLLKNSVPSNSNEYIEEMEDNAKKIEKTMENFGIDCQITHINRGPTITCYELEPDPGVKLNRIVSLSDNIALTLASQDIRIEAPIPGKSAVGIEVPNKNKESVLFKDMVLSKEFEEIDSTIPLTLGKDVSGKPIISTIDKMPHLLIAGATGSGKSVCINTIIMSIIYKSSPQQTKLMLIDPKVVELGVYNDIPHLLIPVVTDPKKATYALNWAVSEMERRYELFAEEGVRNMKGYNKDKSDEEKLPNIVIIIDELADLMMVAAKEIESYICRLAQMARAAGMYLILATQRPSVDVITGTIKANIPSRISFAVSSQIDSRTILDMGGAEKLLGKGDMLYYPSSYSKPKRIQGAFITDDEVEEVVEFLKKNTNKDYNEEVIETLEKSIDNSALDLDPMLKDAAELILERDQASISLIQRELGMGYNRARAIIDDLEKLNVVGGHEGSKPRKILITEEQLEEIFN